MVEINSSIETIREGLMSQTPDLLEELYLTLDSSGLSGNKRKYWEILHEYRKNLKGRHLDAFENTISDYRMAQLIEQYEKIRKIFIARAFLDNLVEKHGFVEASKIRCPGRFLGNIFVKDDIEVGVLALTNIIRVDIHVPVDIEIDENDSLFSRGGCGGKEYLNYRGNIMMTDYVDIENIIPEVIEAQKEGAKIISENRDFLLSYEDL